MLRTFLVARKQQQFKQYDHLCHVCPCIRMQRLNKYCARFTETLCCKILTSSVFWDVAKRRLLALDISLQRIGPIFKGEAVQDVHLGPLDYVTSHKSE